MITQLDNWENALIAAQSGQRFLDVMIHSVVTILKIIIKLNSLKNKYLKNFNFHITISRLLLKLYKLMKNLTKMLKKWLNFNCLLNTWGLMYNKNNNCYHKNNSKNNRKNNKKNNSNNRKNNRNF